VFTNSKNAKIHSGDFGNNLRSRAKKAGITKNVYPQLVRYTHATLMYNQTHDIAMLATLLGHKDIRVTNDTHVYLSTQGIQQASDRNPLTSQYIPINEA
jgi:integrase/recombinase XerD